MEEQFESESVLSNETGGGPSGGEGQRTQPPQAGQDSDKEQNREAQLWAMFCHLAGLAWALFPPLFITLAHIIAPFVLWQIKKDEFEFVDKHGREAVNFQISMTLYAAVSIALTWICVGFFLLAAVVILDFVLVLIAAGKANEGKTYRYPLTIRFFR